MTFPLRDNINSSSLLHDDTRRTTPSSANSAVGRKTTCQNNNDDGDEEDNSLSASSGLLTQACDTPQSTDNPHVASADTTTSLTGTGPPNFTVSSNSAPVSSLVEQQQQNPSKRRTEQQSNQTLAENGDDNDDIFMNNEDDSNLSDDGCSSSSSSSLDDEDDDDDDSVIGIDQRRAMNVERNQARLASLGLLRKKPAIPSRATKRTKANDNEEDEEDDVIDTGRPNGILLPSLLDFDSAPAETSLRTVLAPTSVADIQSRFPHRERQIQKLAALMEVSLAAAAQQRDTMPTSSTYVPAPIFLTGGAGTGKTCITLELLRHYHHQHCQKQHAQTNKTTSTTQATSAAPVPLISYLDCATLDTPTVDEVVRQVVYDLQQQQYAHSIQQQQRQSVFHRHGRRKRRKISPSTTTTQDGRAHPAPSSNDSKEGSVKRLKSPPPTSSNVAQLETTSCKGDDAQAARMECDNDGKPEKQLGEEKGSKKVEALSQQQQQQQQQQLPNRRRTLARRAKQRQDVPPSQSGTPSTKSKRKSKSSSMTAQDIAASSENAMSHSTVPTAAWKLGRIWKRATTSMNHCGGPPPAGFWVIDQAHLLYSMQMPGKQQSQNIEKPNLLAQILLLPQTLGLNLTVIVISNHSFLDQTRLNMMTEPSRSLATLSGAVQPIHLHFPAYRGISVIHSVLRQPRHCRMITGNTSDSGDADPDTNSLQQKVYGSFTNTLIQSVYDSTTDLKEILRLGRLLWPKYVEPLQPERVDQTLATATSCCMSSSSKKNSDSSEAPSPEAIEGQVLAFLNQKILPQMRPFLASSLYTLCAAPPPPPSGSAAASVNDLPELAKYLLLAGYLCQVNRPDRDKHLFSIQKNGRRRKTQTADNTAAENLAFGSTQQQPQAPPAIQRMPRLRSFPMERLLSVYVSVVALNHQQQAHNQNSSTSNAAMSFIEQSERLQSLGNSTLGQHLAYLRSAGFLVEHPPRGSAEVIRLSEPRYWCSLTDDQARQIAQTLNFALDRYLL